MPGFLPRTHTHTQAETCPWLCDLVAGAPLPCLVVPEVLGLPEATIPRKAGGT